MRVAYVCMDPGVPVFGTKGCSVHVQEVVREFVRHGADVTLVATRAGGDAQAVLPGCDVRFLAPPDASDPAEREQGLLDLNAPLRAALTSAGPFDLVYERYSLWSFAGMEYAHAAGIAALLEVNAPLIDEQMQVRRLIHRDRAREVAERSFAAADALLAVSRPVADYLDAWPEAKGRVHVVMNGVDPNRVRPASVPASRATNDQFTIGFVGTLKPWHGLGVLVEAFDRLRSWSSAYRLLVVGSGPEENALIEDLGRRCLLDVTELTGAVPPKRVPDLLATMDVAVAPARADVDFYFSPLKIFEYMAAGLPIVAARIGQIADLIEDNVNGILCTPGDSAAMATAIERLRRDPALGARLGAAARATVVESHTWAHTVDRILELAQTSRAPRAGVEA